VRLSIGILVILLASCSASQHAQAPADSAQSIASAPAEAATVKPVTPINSMPIASGDDLSTAVAEEAVARPATPTLDMSCEVNQDCAIKDIGSCCGANPRCVNANSPTFAEQVKANCAKQSRVGTCGFPAVSGCRCVQGTCTGVGGGSPVR